MLARRFLGCVFVLTLLAVAGALAFYQFGSAMLVRAATPKGKFEQLGRRLVLQVLEIHRERRWVIVLRDIVQGSAFLNTVAGMEVPERRGSREKIAITRTWDMPRAGNRFLSMGRK